MKYVIITFLALVVLLIGLDTSIAQPSFPTEPEQAPVHIGWLIAMACVFSIYISRKIKNRH